MKKVREIYDFFLQGMKSGKAKSLFDFMQTIPEFETKRGDEMTEMNMSLAMEYSKICEQMKEDMLLIQTNRNQLICLPTEYIGVSSVNSSDPELFEKELDYGVYDFKYRGFSYVRQYFMHSVLPVVGINAKGDGDIGTAYCIGPNLFATAAHCVTKLRSFNLLDVNNKPLPIKEIWLGKDVDPDIYDLAVVVLECKMDYIPLWLDNPVVLDKVLTMGYPPIPGFNAVMISETASVGSYVCADQKAAPGEVVSENVAPYNAKGIDHFIITSRVKGGNSGSPVINSKGKVVGTVTQVPFDSLGSSQGGRYDVMGFGICIPSRYMNALLENHQTIPVKYENNAFSLE
jgi:hypothetical protein